MSYANTMFSSLNTPLTASYSVPSIGLRHFNNVLAMDNANQCLSSSSSWALGINSSLHSYGNARSWQESFYAEQEVHNAPHPTIDPTLLLPFDKPQNSTSTDTFSASSSDNYDTPESVPSLEPDNFLLLASPGQSPAYPTTPSSCSGHILYPLVLPTSPSSSSSPLHVTAKRHSSSPRNHPRKSSDSTKASRAPSLPEISDPTTSSPSCSSPPPAKRTRGAGKPRKPHADKPYEPKPARKGKKSKPLEKRENLTRYEGSDPGAILEGLDARYKYDVFTTKDGEFYFGCPMHHCVRPTHRKADIKNHLLYTQQHNGEGFSLDPCLSILATYLNTVAVELRTGCWCMTEVRFLKHKSRRITEAWPAVPKNKKDD
ncbi:hypothetical protein CPC08DRAFT_809079 [Agrocybe pediades]|nr:hypothetical protein CPC08DRAFT_809079 [Agrocybe pediades]